ncbi:patatin-like phospholipase family protein [Tistrella sp. BH-R2-4]|uniref:Patatin-like phospholipase family protein n=1 Tax=Tistrella arctica TaxID=3133430 RepID=A0ABU9YEK5_9PROT
MTRPVAPTRTSNNPQTSAAAHNPPARPGPAPAAMAAADPTPKPPPVADPLPAADPVPPRRRRRRRADAAARRGDPAPQALRPPVIGVALGSGSARGWAHIGVLDGLLREGVTPTVVAGASAGAIVGAFYAAGRLDEFESWVRALTRLKVVRLGDFRMGGGGLVAGDRLASVLREAFGDTRIENLPMPFGAIATDLASGQEVWLTEGDLVDALRASMSIPGIFAPVRMGGRLLVDGGLVNPVPVSLCRHLGAEAVIAVTLHGDLAGYRRRLRIDAARQAAAGPSSARPIDGADAIARAADEDRPSGHAHGPSLQAHPSAHAHGLARGAPAGVASAVPDRRGARRLLGFGGRLIGFGPRGAAEMERRAVAQAGRATHPGIGDVMMSAIAIMQDRISRSRMAGDPPDLVLAPRVGHIRWMEFDHGAQAIGEGAACVLRSRAALQDLCHLHDPVPGTRPGGLADGGDPDIGNGS